MPTLPKLKDLNIVLDKPKTVEGGFADDQHHSIPEALIQKE